MDKVLSERVYKAGYIVKTVLIDGSEYGGRDFEMKKAYTPDGVYIGDSKWAYRLCNKRGIKPEKAQDGSSICSIGFCEREQKWYGWSHRAIYGFGIGSEVKQGDCGYVPVDEEDCRSDIIRFWSDPGHENVTGEFAEQDGEKGVQVNWTYSDDVPNEKIRGTISGVFNPFPQFGRGSWTAKTLKDARLMAADFASGVS